MKWDYSFDDEPVIKFSLNIEDSIIKIYYNSYFSEKEQKDINKRCVLIIDSWKYAYAKSGNDTRYRRLYSQIAIPSMIHQFSYEINKLELLVETFDSQFQYWLFEFANLQLKEINNGDND